MRNATFQYTGPNSAVTLAVPDASGVLQERDVILWHGKSVELPVHHEMTQVLLHQGLLKPLTQAARAATKQTAK